MLSAVDPEAQTFFDSLKLDKEIEPRKSTAHQVLKGSWVKIAAEDREAFEQGKAVEGEEMAFLDRSVEKGALVVGTLKTSIREGKDALEYSLKVRSSDIVLATVKGCYKFDGEYLVIQHAGESFPEEAKAEAAIKDWYVRPGATNFKLIDKSRFSFK